MQKWEYKIIEDWPSESELELLGLEGWELIAVTAAVQYDSLTVLAYLKRPLSN